MLFCPFLVEELEKKKKEKDDEWNRLIVKGNFLVRDFCISIFFRGGNAFMVCSFPSIIL